MRAGERGKLPGSVPAGPPEQVIAQDMDLREGNGTKTGSAGRTSNGRGAHHVVRKLGPSCTVP